jgi:hypothetical protein
MRDLAHDPVILVLSPPRASSTAFARVLWNNPLIRYYAHEPYEAGYFGAEPQHSRVLAEPLDLQPYTGPKTGNGLLIKEITFQCRDTFPALLGAATTPPVFLIRDPRLTVSSRREVLRRSGRDLTFPVEQLGWHALVDQIAYCRAAGVPYLVIDAHDFRGRPEPVFAEVARRLRLPFTSAFLNWQPVKDLALSAARPVGTDHFFTRVLASTGLEPPDEDIPHLDDLPATGGLREHVEWALTEYRQLLCDTNRLTDGGLEWQTVS